MVSQRLKNNLLKIMLRWKTLQNEEYLTRCWQVMIVQKCNDDRVMMMFYNNDIRKYDHDDGGWRGMAVEQTIFIIKHWS